jgi:hypothetical protein
MSQTTAQRIFIANLDAKLTSSYLEISDYSFCSALPTRRLFFVLVVVPPDLPPRDFFQPPRPDDPPRLLPRKDD